MNPDNVIISMHVDTKDENRANLLLQALKNAEHGFVLYMTRSPLNQLPRGVDLIDFPNKEFLRRITFLYSHTFEELCGNLARIHTWTSTPKTVILDGMQDFCNFDKNASDKSAFICGCLVDATSACARKLQDVGNLLVSFDSDECDVYSQQLKHLVSLYFSNSADGVSENYYL